MQKSKVRFLLMPGLIAALSGMLVMSQPAKADIPGQHPHYVHAMSDLRHARWLLNHPEEWNVEHQEQDAVRDIDNAINALTQAAIDDGKNINMQFPADAQLDYRGRLRQAHELLDAALGDLNHEEDNPAALQWWQGAVSSIHHAKEHVDHAMRDKHWDRQNGY